jgi:competence protein ComEA
MSFNRFAAVVIALGLMFVFSPMAAATQTPAQDTTAKPAVSSLINLNSANAAELEKLPGVGPAMATRILEYRQKSGGFKKIEELMNVKGIGEKSFLKLKPLVTVAPVKVFDR